MSLKPYFMLSQIYMYYARIGSLFLKKILNHSNNGHERIRICWNYYRKVCRFPNISETKHIPTYVRLNLISTVSKGQRSVICRF